MREIKFRFWNQYLKIFEKSVDVTLDKKFEGIYAEVVDNINDEYAEIEMQQFTGLYDKNGKHIYEGDILQSEDKDYTFQIVWNDEWARFDYEMVWSKEKNCIHDIRLGRSERYLVIGNIYEHPGLLKTSDAEVATDEGENKNG